MKEIKTKLLTPTGKYMNTPVATINAMYIAINIANPDEAHSFTWDLMINFIYMDLEK